MLRELKFVQGAVSRKNFLPALTHFRIQNKTVRSYNGMLALCAPIQLDIDCAPKAEPFIKAIGNCNETVNMTITPTGRLSVKSGVFRALIDCVTEETPHVVPEGKEIQFNGKLLLDAFKTVYNFIGDDASRPWSNGVLMRGQSAFATNNVTLIEYWIGVHFPMECNIPRAAIKEIIRIDEPPTHAQVTENSITFHYEDGRWIRTQLFSTEWPDLSKVLDRQANLEPINEEIFEAIIKLKPFADKMGRLFINKERFSTSQLQEEGAEYIIKGMQHNGIYNMEMLTLLNGIATHSDLSAYPNPCLFQGERLRGAIVGMQPEMSWEEYNKLKGKEEANG